MNEATDYELDKKKNIAFKCGGIRSQTYTY